MPWLEKAMKDVAICDKPRGADKQALIRGFPNGETQHRKPVLSHRFSVNSKIKNQKSKIMSEKVSLKIFSRNYFCHNFDFWTLNFEFTAKRCDAYPPKWNISVGGGKEKSSADLRGPNADSRRHKKSASVSVKSASVSVYSLSSGERTGISLN